MSLTILSYFTVIFMLQHSAGAVDWQAGDWAMRCDFRGNDIGSAATSGEQCGPTCQQRGECTHFVWTNYNGGTCWMKGGRVSKSDAFDSRDGGMVCGVIGGRISSSSNIDWQPGDWAMSCDFHGNDIGNAATSGEQCGPTCEQRGDCTHFVWTDYNGGTCWMKGGSVSNSDAFSQPENGAVCGVIPGRVGGGGGGGGGVDTQSVGNGEHRIAIVNRCPLTIWVGGLNNPNKVLPGNGGWELKNGATLNINLPREWGGRFWGRTGCSWQNGQFRCASGDCGGRLECAGAGGAPPVSLAEFTFDGWGGIDYYDVSLVDGYNLPMAIKPIAGTVKQGVGICQQCGCDKDLNAICPNELRKVVNGQTVACKSACEALKQDHYCCRGAFNCSPHNRNCAAGTNKCDPATWPVNYAQVFKQACQTSYSYAYDDPSSTFTCAGNPFANYELIFCP